MNLSQVDYGSIGSGGGIREAMQQTEDRMTVVRHHSLRDGELSDGGEEMSSPDPLGMDVIWHWVIPLQWKLPQ